MKWMETDKIVSFCLGDSPYFCECCSSPFIRGICVSIIKNIKLYESEKHILLLFGGSFDGIMRWCGCSEAGRWHYREYRPGATDGCTQGTLASDGGQADSCIGHSRKPVLGQRKSDYRATGRKGFLHGGRCRKGRFHRHFGGEGHRGQDHG